MLRSRWMCPSNVCHHVRVVVVMCEKRANLKYPDNNLKGVTSALWLQDGFVSNLSVCSFKLQINLFHNSNRQTKEGSLTQIPLKVLQGTYIVHGVDPNESTFGSTLYSSYFIHSMLCLHKHANCICVILTFTLQMNA